MAAEHIHSDGVRFKSIRAPIGIRCEHCGVYEGPLCCDKCEKSDLMTLHISDEYEGDVEALCDCGEKYSRCECSNCGQNVEGESIIPLTDDVLTRHVKLSSHDPREKSFESFVSMTKDLQWTSESLQEKVRERRKEKYRYLKVLAIVVGVILCLRAWGEWAGEEHVKKKMADCVVYQTKRLLSPGDLTAELAVLGAYSACVSMCKAEKWDVPLSCDDTFSQAASEFQKKILIR